MLAQTSERLRTQTTFGQKSMMARAERQIHEGSRHLKIDLKLLNCDFMLSFRNQITINIYLIYSNLRSILSKRKCSFASR